MSETIKQRLEYLRGELRAERISYGELAELQSLAAHIEPEDMELREAAGIPEHQEGACVSAQDSKWSLDVASPGEVLPTLRYVIDQYRDSAEALGHAWQDKNAGADWIFIADELERAANRIAKRLGEAGGAQ